MGKNSNSDKSEQLFRKAGEDGFAIIRWNLTDGKFELPEELALEEFMESVFNDDIPAFRIFAGSLKSNNGSENPSLIFRDEKNRNWYRLSGKIITDGGNRFFSAVLTEITTLKEKEEQLEKRISALTGDLLQANNELIRSNSELDQFAYIASHDLQEPLRKIMTFTERFQRKYMTNVAEEGRIFLDKVVDASLRMSRLIDELLRFSRLTRQSKDFEKRDLNLIVKKSLDELEMIITQKDAKIVVGKLPELKVIPLQIMQLFTNIIGNALKFSHVERNPVINISCEEIEGKDLPEQSLLKRNAGYYSITITDNGIGFHQKYAEKIFVIFQRLHEKNLYPGSGIGLAVSRKIVHNHEGEIIAFGKENDGAMFRIFLPRK